MRDFIRKITPKFMLSIYRKFKKKQVRKELSNQKNRGAVITKEKLISDLEKMGIRKGDSVLVHSSMSKIGYLKDGPKTVVDAFLEVIGESGNLLMPNSPNPALQLEYIKKIDYFDVENDVSKLGAISEYHRKLENSVRSWHPTEPVSCIGPDANFFVKDHFGELTPYNENSPFYRVAAKSGKIVMIGVTLDNAGTNLHTLEDAVEDFKYPVYYGQIFEVKIKSPDGKIHNVKTKVHNPEWSAKRKCDELIPLFKEKNVLKEVSFGNAKTLILDARKMLDVMLEAYNENGVTMYTPHGE